MRLRAAFLRAGFLRAAFLRAAFLRAAFLRAAFLRAGFLRAGFLRAMPFGAAALAAMLFAAAFAPAGAHAQGFARRAFDAGPVSGLEMSLEGPTRVRQGETGRWLLAVHEIHGDRDFRPAAGVTVRVLASFRHDAPVAEVVTDAHGRATVPIAIPDDLEGGFDLDLDARAERLGMRRRFRLHVAVGREVSLRLATHPRTAVAPGAPFAVAGTLRDERGAPRAGEAVEIELRRGGTLLHGPREVRVGPGGGFALALEAPATPGEALEVRARAAGTRTATRLQVRAPAAARVEVLAIPARRVAQPGDVVPVTILVRDEVGRPLEGARVSGLPGPAQSDEVPEAHTDARGRAELPWHVRRAEAPFEDRQATVNVEVPGIGRATAVARLRVATAPRALSAVAEAGALVPEVPSRVFVRAVEPDGSPSVGVEVRLASPRLGQHVAETDAAGVATFEVELAPERAEPDACGGATALAVTLESGGARRESCLPVDPDGQLRVRAVADGARLVIGLARRPAVRRAPVLLTLLHDAGDRRRPLAQRVVGAGAGELEWTPLDALPQGELVVRARPLVGPGRAEVRGGVAPVERPPTEAPLRLEVEGRRARVTHDDVALLLLVPAAEVREPAEAPPATPASRAAAQAREAGPDVAAPAVLRDGTIVPLPALEDAPAEGVLRDPWRQRARYRTGRLALVLRALEEKVDAASATGDLEGVAHRARGRWRLNEAVLDSLLGGDAQLGAEGARDLGGLPLSLAQLQALAPALDYDRVARRVTRRRLLETLMALRELVQQRGLDLAFARRGSPADWIVPLVEQVGEGGMRDGWGRPLALRPVRGRARFTLLVPVPGWELVSAGPDGRFGNGDDVVDPTARVLPSGGLYAEAVDEDGLLAQLEGVALGRATLDALGMALAGIDPVQASPSEAAGPAREARLPEPLGPAPDPRFLPARGRDVRVLTAPRGVPVTLAVPEVPARWQVVAIGWRDGRPVLRRRALAVERAARLAGRWPTRLGEAPLEVALDVLAYRPLRGARLRVEATDLEVEGLGEAFELAPGTSARRRLRLRASGPAPALTLLLEDGEGRALWREARRFVRARDGSGRARWGGAFVEGAWPVEVPLDEDAVDVRAHLHVVAPGRLHRDPLVRRWEGGGALRAWAAALAGERLDPSLTASLDAGRARALPEPVDAACAAIAWTALAEALPDGRRHEWMAGYQRALQQLGSDAPGDVATASALLAALAPVAAGTPVAQGSGRVEALVDALRWRLWDAPRRHAEEPAALARAAAALLLADPADASGRALYVAAREASEEAARGALEVPAETPRERVAATAALAVAAHQLGEAEVAGRLLRGAAPRAWMAFAEGGDADAAFWLLAASSYGALGGRSGAVGASVDGEAVALQEGVGVAELEVEGGVAGGELVVEGAALARLELRYRRAVEAREGDFELAVEGTVGRAGAAAPLELRLKAREASARPVVQLRLPPGAELDREARRALVGDDEVRSVSRPTRDGEVRLELVALAAGQEARVPLPLFWTAAGTRRGLALAVWDAERPWDASALPERELEVRWEE
ncbi:MAG: hypothetical protein CMN29_03605 [Sandaracinus sp.]|nr:hypothetical protein [Sandaracinus sp.]